MNDRQIAPAASDEPASPRVAVHAVRSTAIGDVWPSVQPLIEAALAEGTGEESVADVLELLSVQRYQLWVIVIDGQVTAAVITTVVDQPRRRVCRVIYLAGEALDLWEVAIDTTLVSWAKQLKCDAVQIWGRRGWTRTARRLGGKVVMTVYEKELRS